MAERNSEYLALINEMLLADKSVGDDYEKGHALRNLIHSMFFLKELDNYTMMEFRIAVLKKYIKILNEFYEKNVELEKSWIVR